MLGGVLGGGQALLFEALALGHDPVGEAGVAAAAPELGDLKAGGLAQDKDAVAVVVELDEDLHGVVVVDGDGLQEEGVQVEAGGAAQELPMAEVLKPDFGALLAVELAVALGGGDDGVFAAGGPEIAF